MIDRIGDEDYCDACRKVHAEDDVRWCDESAVATELDHLVGALRLEDNRMMRLLLLARAQQMVGRLAQFAAADEYAKARNRGE